MTQLKELIYKLETAIVLSKMDDGSSISDPYKEIVYEVANEINNRLESLEKSVEYPRNKLNNG